MRGIESEGGHTQRQAGVNSNSLGMLAMTNGKPLKSLIRQTRDCIFSFTHSLWLLNGGKSMGTNMETGAVSIFFILNSLYRPTLFYCASLFCTSQILCF